MSQLSVLDNAGFMQVSSIEQAERCAKIIAESSFCPQQMKGKPGDIIVALQMGQELGLKPMQAMQNIAVINGRPSLWGDAMLAVCRQAADFEFINEEYDEKNNAWTCTAKRHNEPPVVRTFSELDAKDAGLWGKPGPWKQYPKRMLQMRARGFALRDAFADVLRGIIIQEEAQDMPVDYSDYKDGKTYEAKVETIQTISPEQEEAIRLLADEADFDMQRVLDYFRIELLSQLPAEQYEFVVSRIQKTMEAKHDSD